MHCCPPWEELNALVDGELSGNREVQLRRHLDTCRTCARYAATVTALKGAVRQASERDTAVPPLRPSSIAAAPKSRT